MLVAPLDVLRLITPPLATPWLWPFIVVGLPPLVSPPALAMELSALAVIPVEFAAALAAVAALAAPSLFALAAPPMLAVFPPWLARMCTAAMH